MRDPNFIDEQRNADYLDAMADIAYEQEEAMRESNQDDWDGIDEISSTESNACDHPQGASQLERLAPEVGVTYFPHCERYVINHD
jgi:hypothetical protein